MFLPPIAMNDPRITDAGAFGGGIPVQPEGEEEKRRREAAAKAFEATIAPRRKTADEAESALNKAFRTGGRSSLSDQDVNLARAGAGDMGSMARAIEDAQIKSRAWAANMGMRGPEQQKLAGDQAQADVMKLIGLGEGMFQSDTDRGKVGVGEYEQKVTMPERIDAERYKTDTEADVRRESNKLTEKIAKNAPSERLAADMAARGESEAAIRSATGKLRRTQAIGDSVYVDAKRGGPGSTVTVDGGAGMAPVAADKVGGESEDDAVTRREAAWKAFDAKMKQGPFSPDSLIREVQLNKELLSDPRMAQALQAGFGGMSADEIRGKLADRLYDDSKRLGYWEGGYTPHTPDMGKLKWWEDENGNRHLVNAEGFSMYNRPRQNPIDMLTGKVALPDIRGKTGAETRARTSALSALLGLYASPKR